MVWFYGQDLKSCVPELEGFCSLTLLCSLVECAQWAIPLYYNVNIHHCVSQQSERTD